MIQVTHITKAVQPHSCDNCNRVMPFVLKYSFYNSKGKEYNKLILCEDCANAVSNLLHLSMEEGKSFKYEYDEIKEVEEIQMENDCLSCKHIEVKINQDPCNTCSKGNNTIDSTDNWESDNESIEVKSYKTWEVIKMLTKNKNLKFKGLGLITVTLFVGNDGFLSGECNGHKGATGNVQLNKEWTLIQEKVSFMEAIQAFTEGKNIRVEFPSPNDENKTLIQKFAQSKNGIGVMKSSDELNFYMILTGKWFIEEEI